MAKFFMLILLGVLLVAFAVAVMVFMFPRDGDSSQWPSVQGTINSSTAYQDQSNDKPPTRIFTSDDWFVSVWFAYEVKGVRYTAYQMWYESEELAKREQHTILF